MTRNYLVLTVAFFYAAVPSLKGAAISLVDIFKNTVYTQNSAAAPVTPSGFFSNVELTSQNAGDFTNVSVAYPGPGSPATLTKISPTFFSIGPSFASQAAMNAAVPFGAYNYTATNGAVTNTAALNYTADAFTSAIPALSAASFNALNGLNPNTVLNITFNSFTPSAAASQGLTFFSIFNSSGTVFTSGFLAPGSTSLLLPANTLAANTAYTFELDFSDRINGTDANGNNTLVGSDVRTDGTFTTGSAAVTAPEPTTAALMGCALAAAATISFRKARRRVEK